jgi:hypothetical protein
MPLNMPHPAFAFKPGLWIWVCSLQPFYPQFKIATYNVPHIPHILKEIINIGFMIY